MSITEDLLKACRDQNRVAQKQVYELLLPYLRAVARRYLRDISFEKDVLQESYFKIFKKLNQYDLKRGPFKNWAAKIVVNDCLNYNKRVIGEFKEELDTDQHELMCSPEAITNLSNDHLLYILKQMPSGYFEVFNLYVIDGYKHDEIAETLKISESLSRQRLSRARGWLKKTFVNKALNIFDLTSLSINN